MAAPSTAGTSSGRSRVDPRTAHDRRRAPRRDRRGRVRSSPPAASYGASTEAIARRVGVSQPYVFQLFGTKKELFLAVVRRCFERTRLAFEDGGPRWARRGPTAIRPDAMGQAYCGSWPTGRCCLSSSRPTRRAPIRTSGPSSAKSRAPLPSVRELVRSRRARRSLEFREGMLLNIARRIGCPGRRPSTLELADGGA